MQKIVVKPKENLDQLVTVGLMRKEFKKEIKKELKNYPTKVDMARAFDNFRIEMREMFEEYTAKMTDVVATFKDEIIGELKTIQEEMGAMQYRISEHSDQLEDHEGRLARVELRLADK